MVNEDKPHNPIKDVGWLALFLIVIGVIWVAQGGPQRLTSSQPLLKYSRAPSSGPAQDKEKISKTTSEGLSAPQENSRYKEKVSLTVYGAKETSVDREYLEIRAGSMTEPILITDWTLEGRQGLDIAIGKGSYLVYSGQINSQDHIYLEPGGKAVIVTGQSPIGTSFRLNVCTGYFNQFQKFIPHLSEECPRVSEENPPFYPDACFDFVNRLSRCDIPVNISLENQFKIGNDCLLFISEKANYNGCVDAHKDDKDFYKKEWRVYLGRGEEMWSNKRDRIILRDQEGKIVDEVSY